MLFFSSWDGHYQKWSNWQMHLGNERRIGSSVPCIPVTAEGELCVGSWEMGMVSNKIWSFTMSLMSLNFLYSHWYPCFGLLVMSALGFKAIVHDSPCLCALPVVMLRFNSSVQNISMAVNSFGSSYLQIISTTLDRFFNPRPFVLQYNAKPFGHLGSADSGNVDGLFSKTLPTNLRTIHSYLFLLSNAQQRLLLATL